MDDGEQILLEHWTVDYGDGTPTEEVTLPHAWKQDVHPSYEGPVTYRTSFEAPKEASKLVFGGVSYACEVLIDGVKKAEHKGIWDAFEVPILGLSNRRVELEVRVTKNGGPTYPVTDVASGFLPYVFHTFGGIYGSVKIVDESVSLEPPAPAISRVRVDGSQIFVDEKPFYPRGLLHWGWYPDLGHTRPTADVIRKEARDAKKLGFNLVKFCLWVPSHLHLEILREEGMEAWLELPVWNPSPDKAKQDRIAAEIEAVVRQYRRHDNIILWTVGCELSQTVTPEFRRDLTQMVRNLTHSPLVKDNSGGAEMYGGDLREYGDFYDYHPYCETPFYAGVLDSLLPGPRTQQPVLLGEFNDSDVHRDLLRLSRHIPYWSSTLSELNDQGVRWQYDLPAVLSTSRLATDVGDDEAFMLVESSRRKSLFMRKSACEAVRSRAQISGYVVTGWRDTPISTSGFFNDWDESRYSAAECLTWNGPVCLFLIPARQPKWLHGGNRAGFSDPLNQFAGHVYFRVGAHSDAPVKGGLAWKLVNAAGTVVAKGHGDYVEVKALNSVQIAEIGPLFVPPDEYRLDVEFAGAGNSWPIEVIPNWTANGGSRWSTDDPAGLLGFDSRDGDRMLSTRKPANVENGLFCLTGDGTIPKPFWREAAYEFRNEAFWEVVPFAERWERLAAISPDRVIDPVWLFSLADSPEILMNRIDVRTYEEHPIMARIGGMIVTTLRPFGGLGVQPAGIPSSPAGLMFLRSVGTWLG